MSEFNPTRIDWARRYRGWTKKELAEYCEVSAPRMTQIINGDGSNITESLAQRVAFETGFPVTFFMLGTTEVKEDQLTFRQKARVKKSVTDSIVSEFSILADVLTRVRNLGEIPADISWLEGLSPSGNVCVSDIRSIAKDTRAYWGESPTGPIRNITRCLERNDIPVIPLTAQPEGDVSDGVTCPARAEMPAFVGYFPESKPGDRLRFTIAHELGHIILHRKRIPADRQMMEREAHVFAGELLMPYEDVKTTITKNTTLEEYAQIKAGWGTSIAAIIHRAKDVGILDNNRYKSLYVQMSRRHWMKSEPITVNPEHPILFKQLVGRAFNGLDDYNYPSVTRSGVEGFLGVPFGLLNAWCDHHLTLKKDEFPELS